MTLIATRLLAPRNDSYLAVPLSWAVGPADRWLCVPGFRRVCPLQIHGYWFM